MRRQTGGLISLTVMSVVLLALAMFSVGAVAQDARQSGLDPDYPTTVSNNNIWKIYTDYQVMIEEVDKSLSKGNAGMLTHDATRWLSYLTNLRNYTNYWQAQAFLDLPVTHGRDWTISDPLNPPCNFKDNTAACEYMALLVSARDELVLSASAELPMHLYQQDLARQQSYWTSMEGYIQYMLANSPLDEPVTAAEENLGLTPGFDHQE